MDSPQSPRPMDAQVEPPEDVPRAMSAHSYYRVRSESTLEELQNQLDEQAMAGGGSASERLDRIVPEPESPATMPKTGSLDLLGAESKDEAPVGNHKCCQAAIDRLCLILFLPIGVVLQGRSRWVATVRSAAMIVCIMLWAACLYSAVTGSSTGWQMGSCLQHLCEATANLILLAQKNCSTSFHKFNAYAKEATHSLNMASAQKSAIKWHTLAVLGCLASWMLCHAVKVRLVALGGGEMTWQVILLPCLQCLYRGAWVLWLLRLNEFVNGLVDAFCRTCASNPEDVESAYIRWTRVTAFTGQITHHCQAVYVVMFVTALTGGIGPLLEIFLPSSLPSQNTSWVLPQLMASITACWLMTYIFGSAAEVSEKCRKAVSFVNYLQGCLPGQVRAELRWLVHYMERSDSGIFFGGSKLNLSWLSRLRYLIFSASVFLAARLQTLPEARKVQLLEQWSQFLRALAVWD